MPLPPWVMKVAMKVGNMEMEDMTREMEGKTREMETETEIETVKEVWTQTGLVTEQEIGTQTPQYGLLTKEGLFSTT